MSKIFTRERFGTPQFIAGLLLLCFVAQCIWLMHVHPIVGGEAFRIQQGLAQLQEGRIEVTDQDRSALYYVMSATPLLFYHGATDPTSLDPWRLLARSTWLLLGIFVGASVWYVARRLYGNTGGYVALLLYCFSPVMISHAAGYDPQPETAAMWGSFGVVFTAIAVSHTLYAPRHVLWNWKRILLLALSLVLAVGSQFSLIVLVPMALAFLLYLAPGRRAAALAIFAVSCILAFAIWSASYSFSWGAIGEALRHARFWPEAGEALGMSFVYAGLAQLVVRTSPALVVLIPLALIAYAAWPRTRYFGNTAPLLVVLLLVVLGLMTPHEPGRTMLLVAMPILFVFVAGVIADLAETKYRQLVIGLVAGLLGAHLVWSLSGLLRLGS